MLFRSAVFELLDLFYVFEALEAGLQLGKIVHGDLTRFCRRT